MRIWHIIALSALVIVCTAWLDSRAHYAAYAEGRKSMYDEMVAAAGGMPGAKLQVLQPDFTDIFVNADICSACHKAGELR